MDNDIVMNETKEIIDTILSRFDNYDKSVDSGINIIESNQGSIDKLKELFAVKNIILDDNYRQKVESIIDRQSKLLRILEVEKTDIFNKMKQIQNKNNVVNNYMNIGIKSIFIDKDT